MDFVSPQQIVDHIPLLKYRNRGFFLSEYVPTLDKDIFAFINTQASSMQSEHWIMIASSRQILYIENSFGRKK